MGVAGALERDYLKDQTFFVQQLAKMLLEAMPGEVETKTTGFLKKTVVGVVVSFGDARYTFEKPDHGPVFALKTKVVRGIALKSDEIDVGVALHELGEALEQRAAKSGQARTALASALGLE